MAEKSESPKTGMFSNILAVAGLVVLIAIIIWGLSHLASLSKSLVFSSFSSLFYPSSKSIKVTVPSGNIPSGEEFAVSWKYTPKSTGTYALLYQCHEGFQFKTGGTGSGSDEIPCGTGYTMPASGNKFSVTPFLTGTSSLTVPLSIIFMSSAPTAPGQTASQPQGNTSVTVTNAYTAAEPSEPAPATEMKIKGTAYTTQKMPVATPTIQSITGNADLSVKILSVGVIDPLNGAVIQREPVSESDVVAVRFLISNNGGKSTGEWYFTAQLPTSFNYPYSSPAQNPLAQGASIENTLRFNNAIPGGIFSVSVDPVNGVVESSEINNTASMSI